MKQDLTTTGGCGLSERLLLSQMWAWKITAAGQLEGSLALNVM
jgi:hypothetical protein